MHLSNLLSAASLTGDARPRFFESRGARAGPGRRDAREAMTVSCKPTIDLQRTAWLLSTIFEARDSSHNVRQVNT